MLQQAVCFGVMDAPSVSLGAAGELWVTAFQRTVLLTGSSHATTQISDYSLL